MNCTRLGAGLTVVLSVQIPDPQVVLRLGAVVSCSDSVGAQPRRGKLSSGQKVPSRAGGEGRRQPARAVPICRLHAEGLQQGSASHQDRHAHGWRAAVLFDFQLWTQSHVLITWSSAAWTGSIHTLYKKRTVSRIVISGLKLKFYLYYMNYCILVYGAIVLVSS